MWFIYQPNHAFTRHSMAAVHDLVVQLDSCQLNSKDVWGNWNSFLMYAKKITSNVFTRAPVTLQDPLLTFALSMYTQIMLQIIQKKFSSLKNKKLTLEIELITYFLFSSSIVYSCSSSCDIYNCERCIFMACSVSKTSNILAQRISSTCLKVARFTLITTSTFFAYIYLHHIFVKWKL